MRFQFLLEMKFGICGIRRGGGCRGLIMNEEKTESFEMIVNNYISGFQ